MNNDINYESNNREAQVMTLYIAQNCPLDITKNMYTPLEVGYILSRHMTKMVDGIKISKLKLIAHLISKKLIPIQKTTAYNLESYVSLGVLPITANWTDLSKHGRKALLSPSELMHLVNVIRNESKGGEGMSSDTIKEKLKNISSQFGQGKENCIFFH